MSQSTPIEQRCERLIERYDDLGRLAVENLRRWIGGQVPMVEEAILERFVCEGPLELIFDSFWQVLPFGTGGRRGRVGYGSNRLNPATVAMTVQGHCDHLRRAYADGDDLTVVVACDVREYRDAAGELAFLGDEHPLLGVSSRSLGRLACEIYAGNGFRVYFPHPDEERAVLTTPELSFLIARRGALGGINLSASHNPPDDNGTKIYDAFGSQPVAPHDQALMDVMNEVTAIRRLPYEEARREGLVLEIPETFHEEYLATYLSLHEGEPDPAVPIVYTPLCGCGMTTVGDLLSRLGFSVLVPPEQKDPDGSFAVIPFRAPNPEVLQATAPARQFADQKGVGVVLSTDPDADRIGLEVRLDDGSWYHFDGNQIAAVLTYYLMLDPEGPRKKGLVIETLVTTKILGAIAREAGDSWIVDDLLVGFKYVADVLHRLETEGAYGEIRCRPEDLVIAAEESHGVALVPGIRDKDASGAALFLAVLYQKLVGEGRTFLDYYVSILDEVGGYDCVNRSIMLLGAEGVMQRDAIMADLRAQPPASLAGRRVELMVDYWDEGRFGPFRSESDRLPRNVLQVFTEGLVVTIRPSGTEPKLKLYCQLLPEGAPAGEVGTEWLHALRAATDGAARSIYNDLLARIGYRLSEHALCLPDIVDIEKKIRFDQETVPALLDRLQQCGENDLSGHLQWLQAETAAMTPGADPLPALESALTLLSDDWERSGLAASRALRALGGW